MNSLIETLNVWGERFLQFTGPMLWQSSLLIVVLFALDFALRRKVRAVVRYTLWLVVLVKLLLPPTLALPTGVAWWLRPTPPAAKPETRQVIVTYGKTTATIAPTIALPPLPPPPPKLSRAGGAVVASAVISFSLLAWMVFRWRQVARMVRAASLATEALNDLLDDGRRSLGLRRAVRLHLTDLPMSPAVCGLFRPVILLPRSLAEQLPPNQLRAVLLHELVHLRRGDVWVNCAQALLQIAYWWNPLLWLANAHIRRIREEAVDDAVMLALRDDAETYAPTLLKVAKLAFHHPLASLGLVGIMESRSALRQRIERLVNYRTPAKSGLTLISVVCVLAFGALAVPLGNAPVPEETPSPKVSATVLVQEARVFLDAGKLDDAEVKLNQVIALDADNQEAAYYYLNQIKQRRNVSPANPPLSSPDSASRTNRGRQAIVKKLDSIRLDHVAYDAMPLGELLLALSIEARKRDPEKRGVNFIVNPNATAIVTNKNSSASYGPMDLAILPVSLQPALTNVLLTDVLGAIVKSAPAPIRFSIEDYAIVFSFSSGQQTDPLFVRTFKIDPNTVFGHLRERTGLTSTNAEDELTALRSLFAERGVELQAPKNLYYKPHQGMLLIRATMAELDRIETVIQELNDAPPQVNIKVRFVEISESDSSADGIDWYLGNLLQTINAGQRIPGNATPKMRAKLPALSDAGQDISRIATSQLTGVLTDPQYRVILSALEQRKNVNLLAQQEVTTLSGRQAQIQTVEMKTVVTGIKPEALTPPGVTSTNKEDTAPFLTSETIPFGPTLDVTPIVSADGFSIHLTVIPTINEFLGFTDPKTNTTIYVNGQMTHTTLPLPRIRIRQMTTSIRVWDGQTVVLGNPRDQVITKQPYGDTTMEDFTAPKKRNLLIFITATIIDPAGNRVQTDDQMPPGTQIVPPPKPAK